MTFEAKRSLGAEFLATEERAKFGCGNPDFEIDVAKIARLRDSYCSDNQDPNEICITGISGRFPGCDNLGEFEELLIKKQVPKTKIRTKREYFDDSPELLTLNDITKFDRKCFSMPQFIAEGSDPQLRILHEVVHEAIIDAGYAPDELKGQRIAVYCGLSRTDSPEFSMSEKEGVGDVMSMQANVRSYYANYISYTFDFKGPSYSIFTECSSALYALSRAIDDINGGKCKAAIVATVHIDLITYIRKFISDIELKVSGSGITCKFGECIGALFLQKADVARRIYAGVAAIGQMHYGYLTEGQLISQRNLENLFHTTYTEAGINPVNVDYVECDLFAAVVGFETEVNAVRNVFCTSRENPLIIGTVKNNVGHCGAASGFCSIAKAALSLYNSVLYPTCNDNELSQCSCLSNSNLKLSSTYKPWNGKLIGVNSFSIIGSSIHVCLRRVGNEKKECAQVDPVRKLVLFSSRIEAGIKKLFDVLKTENIPSDISCLLNKTACSPDIFSYRGYTVMGQKSSCIKQLGPTRKPLWLVLNAWGVDWPGMCLGLMEIELFADIMKKLNSMVQPLGLDLMELLRPASLIAARQRRKISHILIVTMCTQMCLLELLNVLGIKPDGVIGFCTGEIVASFSATPSIFDTSGAPFLEAIFYIMETMEERKDVVECKSLIVGLDWIETQKRCPIGVYACAMLDKNATVVVGPSDKVNVFYKQLVRSNVYSIENNTLGVSFHSPYSKVIFNTKSERMQRGKKMVDAIAMRTTPHWFLVYDRSYSEPFKLRYLGFDTVVDILTSPSYFYDALLHLPKGAVTIEIGPDHVFDKALANALGPESVQLSLMERGTDSITYLLQTIGRLYTLGFNPQIENLGTAFRFPVPRGLPTISNFVSWDHSEEYSVYNHAKEWFDIDLHNLSPSSLFLADYHVNLKVSFPASGFLVLVWQYLAETKGKSVSQTPVIFENVKVLKEPADLDGFVRLRISVLTSSGKFEVLANEVTVATGRVCAEECTFVETVTLYARQKAIHLMERKDVYKEMECNGYVYGPEFQRIIEVDIEGKRGLIEWKSNWVTFLDAALMFPCIWKKQRGQQYPFFIKSIKINPHSLTQCRPHLSQTHSSEVLKGFSIFYDKRMSKCYSCGVEIEGILWKNMKESNLHETIYSEFSFVPFLEICSMKNRKGELEDYFNACIKEANQLSSIAVEETESSKTILDSHNFNIPKKGQVLLPAIRRAAMLITKDDQTELTKDLGIRYYLKNLSADVLYTYILESQQLESIIRITEENLNLDHIRAIEVIRGNISFSQYVCRIASRRRGASWKFSWSSYTLSKQFSAVNGNVPISDKIDVIISSYLHGCEKDLKNYVHGLSELSADKFVILLYRSNVTLPEKILREICNSSLDINSVDVLEEILRKKKFCIIAKKFNEQGMFLYLLRKLVTRTQVFHVVEDYSKSFAADVKGALNIVQSKENSSLWVVFKGMLYNDKYWLVKHLQQEAVDKIRFAFIENEKATTAVDINYPLPEEILHKDLVINVKKDGQWGTYQHLEYVEEFANSTCWVPRDNSEMQIAQETCAMYFVGLSFHDHVPSLLETVGSDVKGNNCIIYEFSGSNADGQIVCGLTANHIASSVSTNECLTWNVPSSWTLEQACTVPLAYTVAFYALVMLAKIQENSSVFIHCLNEIGQAAVNVALSKNCTVYATVGSRTQKEFLLEMYPKLKDENIGWSRTDSFKQLVLHQTKGKGVDIVLNCVSGDHLHTSFKCVANNGYFIDVSGIVSTSDSQIGMLTMLKNINFFQVNLDDLRKKKFENFVGSSDLHALVNEGISSGIVKPLQSKVFYLNNAKDACKYASSKQHIEKILLKIRNEESDMSPKPLLYPGIKTRFFDSRKSYIVIGGHETVCMSFIDWIVSHGAKKIMLAFCPNGMTAYKKFHMKLFSKQGVQLTLSSITSTELTDVTKLFHETQELGTVGGIFNLGTRQDVVSPADWSPKNFESYSSLYITHGSVVNVTDALSRSMCPDLDWFICFSSICAEKARNIPKYSSVFEGSTMERVCMQRRKDGYHGLTVHWRFETSSIKQGLSKDSSILPDTTTSLFTLLDNFISQPKPIMCSFVTPRENKKVGLNHSNIFAELYELLGNRIQKKANVYKGLTHTASEPARCQVMKLNTSTCGTPLFIVLQDDCLQKYSRFAESLEIPIYAMIFNFNQCTESIEHIARSFLMKLQEDFSYETISLAGNSYCSLVAFEMALQSLNFEQPLAEVKTVFSINGWSSFLHIFEQECLKDFTDELNHLARCLIPMFGKDMTMMPEKLVKLEDRSQYLNNLADVLISLNPREADLSDLISHILLAGQIREMQMSYFPTSELSQKLVLVETEEHEVLFALEELCPQGITWIIVSNCENEPHHNVLNVIAAYIKKEMEIAE